MKIARSTFSGRLREFESFLFGDEESAKNRGQWRDFFRRRIGPAFDGRIIVEIGCSDAGYLCKIAPKFPATGFIGLDWKCKSLYVGAQKIAAMCLNNIGLLNAHGQDVPRLFAGEEVDEIWVFHPEPLDGEIESKNRLIAAPFLAAAHQILRNDQSVMAIKTDHLGYHESILRLAESGGGPPSETGIAVRQCFDLTMTSADFWHDPIALAHTAGRCFSGETTFYEDRFLKKRMPIYYVEFRKKTADADVEGVESPAPILQSSANRKNETG